MWGLKARLSLIGFVFPTQAHLRTFRSGSILDVVGLSGPCQVVVHRQEFRLALTGALSNGRRLAPARDPDHLLPLFRKLAYRAEAEWIPLDPTAPDAGAAFS